MKHLWMIVSTLAIANLLAIAALLVWLQTSDRLNKDRVMAIRAVLSPTIVQEAQTKADAEAGIIAESNQTATAAKLAVPPVPAAERIAEAQLQTEKDLQSVLRRQQELQILRDGLLRQMADLEQRERKLAEQKTAFDTERARIIEVDGAQQFKTALSTLESQKPKDAKSVLKALMDIQQVDQVVAYLSKMDETKRSKVVAEFVKDEPAVAADLLERLRTRGLFPPPPPAAKAGAIASNDTAAPDQPLRTPR